MIALVFAGMRSRWGQLLGLALLAVFATAAAVAAPAYLTALDRAEVSNELAAASPAERSVVLSGSVDKQSRAQGVLDLGKVASALIQSPGFTQVYSGDFTVLGLEPQSADLPASRFSYRQEVCAHLVVVSGRCLVAPSEVVIGEQSARRLHLSPGDAVSLAYAEQPPPERNWVVRGVPATLTIVGTYRPRNPDETYWGEHGYFQRDTTGRTAEPIFAGQNTFAAMDHNNESVSIDSFADASALASGRQAALAAQLKDVSGRAAAIGPELTVKTDIPALLTRVDRGRTLAHQLVPMAAVPLVLLAWFVIFMAAGYGAEQRRLDLGLISLRGVRLPGRAFLATAEQAIAILAGAVAGYLLAGPVVSAVARLRLDAAGDAGPAARLLPYALVAAAGALVAALAASWRSLFTPVASLLREIPAAFSRWRAWAGEAVLVLLAAAGAVQLRFFSGGLTGIGILVPALVVFALAVLAARAVAPLAGWYARRGLRTGNLAGALAALTLHRRPGAQRLFVLLTVAVAVSGFGISAADVGAAGRATQATVSTGAPRVLSVNTATRRFLLNAVRAADPAGRWAMAVASVPDVPGEAPKLAVDGTRLGTASTWLPAFGSLSAAEVGRRLRPPAPAPVPVLRGDGVAVDVRVDTIAPDAQLNLNLTLAPLSGSPAVISQLGQLTGGEHTYTDRVPDCVAGCRVVGFAIDSGSDTGYQVTITLRDLRVTSPQPQVVVAPGGFSGSGAWRSTPSTRLTPLPEGLRLGFDTSVKDPGDGWLTPVDMPYPLPVASTGALRAGTRLFGLDEHPTEVTEVARVSGLPRLGNRGTLVDLEYADLAATDAGTAQDAQVWLGRDAPVDALARLAATGLVIIGDTGVGAERQRLDKQSAALSLWFYLLVAVFAVVFAAGAAGLGIAVDRRRRSLDLSALRVQGVARSVIGRAMLAEYLIVMLSALVAGLLAALIAWWVVGGQIPVSLYLATSWPPPTWPRPVSLLVPWACSGLVFLGVALISARGRYAAISG